MLFVPIDLVLLGGVCRMYIISSMNPGRAGNQKRFRIRKNDYKIKQQLTYLVTETKFCDVLNVKGQD